MNKKNIRIIVLISFLFCFGYTENLYAYIGPGAGFAFLTNFAKIKEQGSFTCLGTTLPAMSPVAWSSFITGVNPSKHNIYDFLSRNKQTYLPELSSSQISNTSRVISFGKYQIPIGKPKIQLLRKSKTFWNILSEKDITSSILRDTINFPPEKFKGVLLSAMCV